MYLSLAHGRLENAGRDVVPDSTLMKIEAVARGL